MNQLAVLGSAVIVGLSVVSAALSVNSIDQINLENFSKIQPPTEPVPPELDGISSPDLIDLGKSAWDEAEYEKAFDYYNAGFVEAGRMTREQIISGLALGQMYFEGIGTEKNIARAYLYANIFVFRRHPLGRNLSAKIRASPDFDLSATRRSVGGT